MKKSTPTQDVTGEIEALKKEALTAVEKRGHNMTPFKETIGCFAGNTVFKAVCTNLHCGCWLYVQPPFRGVKKCTMIGNALNLNCVTTGSSAPTLE